MAHSTFNSTFAGSGNQGLQVGHNPGRIEAHFYAAGTPETPPKPSCTVPFRRDPDFVDRGALLDRIREKCSAPASRIALVGLGGVGKSQLVIEHCYRTANESPDMWVFWVHASNAALLEQSYQDIADLIKLPSRKDPQADIYKLVHGWLRNERNGKWLLILDNADDASVFSRPRNSDRRAQINGEKGVSLHFMLPPSSKNGSVVITTRSRGVALQMVEDDDVIAIEPMNDASAQVLLSKKLGEGVEKDGIPELAAALEFMPLALVQAAAYIRHRAPRCSVRQYLEAFQESDKNRMSLLDYRGGHLRRDNEAKNSILITWQISFDHILRARRSAAHLLSLMSFFDRHGVPEALVRPRNETRTGPERAEPDDGDSKRSNSDNGKLASVVHDQFEEDVHVLRDYSFIALTTNTASFEMHALVQLATRKWLEGQNQLELWKEQFIYRLYKHFPKGHYEHWTQCQALFPHVQIALSQRPESKNALGQWASLLYSSAWYAWVKGNPDAAKKLAMTSMMARKEILGIEHPNTLSSMSMVAKAYKLQGREREAEELEAQVLEIRKRVLGVEHPATLNSMAALALTYTRKGQNKEAEELEVQLVEVLKRVLGPEHINTLTTMANLAATYIHQKQWAKAEKLCLQTMETLGRVHGVEHPIMLGSMANLAVVYVYEQQWEKAEERLIQVIEMGKRVFGAEHPRTLVNMSNLATLHDYQGRFQEAKELEAQTLEIRKRVLGPEHPETLASIAFLSQLDEALKAEEERSVETRQEQLPILSTSETSQEGPPRFLVERGISK